MLLDQFEKLDQNVKKMVDFVFKLKIENDKVYDYFITPSGTKENLKVISEHFQIPPEIILVLGYPRNDIFFNDNPKFSKKIRKKINVPDDIKRIILYAPTFRDYDLTARFPLSEGDLIELNKMLKSRNSILLMKAHKAEKKIEFKNFSNIKDIKKDSDIQELLFISDVLITDYSSVYVDYLLLDRPIIFFTYDYEFYEKENRGLQYDLKTIAPGPLIYSGKELIKSIRNISLIEQEYKDKRNLLNNEFNKYQDGKSTERLLNFLKILK